MRAFCEVNNLSVEMITYFTVIQTDAYILDCSPPSIFSYSHYSIVERANIIERL